MKNVFILERFNVDLGQAVLVVDTKSRGSAFMSRPIRRDALRTFALELP